MRLRLEYFMGAIFYAFAGKLFGFVNSWLYVFAPLWIPLLIILIVIAGVFLFVGGVWIVEWFLPSNPRDSERGPKEIRIS